MDIINRILIRIIRALILSITRINTEITNSSIITIQPLWLQTKATTKAEGTHNMNKKRLKNKQTKAINKM